MNQDELKILSQIESQNRINELMIEIKIINSYDEYLRLKYYNLMIYKIKLLKSYIEVI